MGNPKIISCAYFIFLVVNGALGTLPSLWPRCAHFRNEKMEKRERGRERGGEREEERERLKRKKIFVFVIILRVLLTKSGKVSPFPTFNPITPANSFCCIQ